ncbi:CIC11C00000005316 [Sungouiella intermedia]|uniref:CIC11C00000005316 n=1 Tax=Sungouiella intermedia TaxID=45354 RepID=A0A1L0BEZ2_9ASCO|nr:CIC11C00000005316 [[Candida] intermedia]
MSKEQDPIEWDTVDTGPEVFETSDVESVEMLDPPEEQSTDVDKSVLHPSSAKEHFEHSVVTDKNEVVDFLGSLISIHGNSGYNVRRVYEMPAQKLARIQAELEELKTQKIHENEVDKLTEDLEKLLGTENLDAGIHEQKLRTVFEQISQRLTGLDESSIPASGNRKRSEAEVLELEKRLHELEEIVGVEDFDSSKSVRNHVDDLGRKLEVLYDPEYDMGHLKGEIKRLAKEMDELNAKRRMAQIANGDIAVKPSTPFDTKVDSIYEILPEMEKAMAVVPNLVSRLKSLHHVHAEIGHSVSAISDIDKTIQSLHLEMKTWNENLDQVNLAIDAHTKKFEANREGIEARIEGFEKRLADISRIE